MKKKTAELRVRVDDKVYDALKRVAKEEGRTVSELVREAVAEWLRDRLGAGSGQEND
jgi:predicted DNA-binding protein